MSVIFVIGGPGCGKGTQCQRIVQKYGFTHLSTGELLRNAVNSGSENGKNICEIMKRGDLVPNEEVIKLLKEAIAANPNSKGFLIDGFPRELTQAIEFEKSIRPCDLIIYFECSDETMTKRALDRATKSGRADDNQTTIKNRIKTFHGNTNLILDHYTDKVVKVNGEGSIEKIFGDVSKSIDSRLFN